MGLQAFSTGFVTAVALIYIFQGNVAFYTGYFLTSDDSQDTFLVLERNAPDSTPKHFLFACRERGKPLKSDYENNTNQTRFYVGVEYLCTAVDGPNEHFFSDDHTTTTHPTKDKRTSSEDNAEPEISMKTTQDKRKIQREATSALNESMYLEVNIPWQA